VKEGLLLDGIALRAANVSPRDVQRASAVVAHLANPRLPIRDGATMTAGITTHPIAVEFFVEVAFSNLLVDDFAKGGHGEESLPVF
jgi:hypothetical protein